jgi:hypothetical protein
MLTTGYPLIPILGRYNLAGLFLKKRYKKPPEEIVMIQFYSIFV